MAAIGGIFNTDASPLDTDALLRMSRAMLTRGGRNREAYIREGAGFAWGMGADERECCAAFLRGDSESEALLLCDGEVYTEGEAQGERARFFGESDASLALEGYLGYGSALGEHFSGEYAIAAYDSRKKELLLLRGGSGGRPLYFAREGGRIAFASEIKGLRDLLGGSAAVDVTRLRSHIFSPCGQYSGGALYRDIYEIEKNGGCVCSRLGIAPFTYDDQSVPTLPECERRTVFGGFACPDEEGMRRLLCEVLFAFDYPQFDCLMPSFLRDLPRAEEVGGAVIDGTLCCDIGYSLERRDRLGVLSGVRVPCVPPEKSTVKERELKKMEKVMKSLLLAADREALRHIFGDGFEGEILREGNTARRIRIMGMMMQTVVWYESYNIFFV